LTALGAQLGVSSYHLQRTFKRILGITPRQYADAHRLHAFKSSVKSGRSITDALYDAGYGSGSRLYEQSTAHLGMQPSVYQKGGLGMEISYSTAACPLGRLLVAATERGISAVYLGDADGELEEALRREFPAARLRRDGAELSTWIAAIVRFLDGHQPDLQLPLDVRATAFQWRVWQELMQIPHGEVSTYSDIAQRLGQPGAVRAVARACATNPASLVIPCHRVVRRDGALGGYRWGLERKRSLLQREGAPASHGPSTSVETGALE
jgi:AraC family transcriptional regulator of adaptative response/methylated-DNA-[protein]-cysteine methyltransferase